MTYYFRSFINAAAIVLGLLVLATVFAVVVTSCTVERQAVAIDAKVDSTLVAAGLPPLSVGKLVFRGPVTLQVGQGNTSATVGTDKTGQRAQAVSTGANSPVAATSKQGGVSWWVFLLVAVGSVVGWEYFSHKFSPLGWLPWRARPA